MAFITLLTLTLCLCVYCSICLSIVQIGIGGSVCFALVNNDVWLVCIYYFPSLLPFTT